MKINKFSLEVARALSVFYYRNWSIQRNNQIFIQLFLYELYSGITQCGNFFHRTKT